MTFVVDVDDTLLVSEKTTCKHCYRVEYKNARPNKTEINYLNELFKLGHKIILWTGRNWDCYDLTKRQLESNHIKYHELVMGKPQGIYIDADAETSLEEVYNDVINSTA